MATKYSINNSNRYAPTGYEGNNESDYVIPSCGIEDLDKSVFNLFDKEMPLFYSHHGKRNKVPVIFASGERFAVLARKRPITDENGALILPLISITRTSIDNIPQKGISNNQMFPNTIVKRISKKDLAFRQSSNIEGLNNSEDSTSTDEPDISLKPRIEKNIIETIEMPPVKYFSANYEISIWSSFTQQMNKLLEAIMNAYTLNPGQQFQLESDKGYKFSGFIDSSFAQDANYSDFTDAERYIKYNLVMNATGYIIAPNIEGGKTALRSFLSAPKVSFDVATNNVDLLPTLGGVTSSSPDAHIFDDLRTEDDFVASQQVAINDSLNRDNLLDYDKSKGFAVGATGNLRDNVAQRTSANNNKKIVYMKDSNGKTVPVSVRQISKSGETIFDENAAEVLFNISSK